MGHATPHEPTRVASDTLVGVLMLLGAGCLWSLNGALIKLTNQTGVDGVTIAFYRSLFAGLCLWPLGWGRMHTLLRTGGPWASARAKPPPEPRASARAKPPQPYASPSVRHDVKPERTVEIAQPRSAGAALLSAFSLRPAALSCVLFFTLMTICFVVANIKTEAANAIILQYTSTFWVFGLSPWLLGERPQARDLWILLLAMIGIGIIFAGRATTDLAGLVIALGAGLFYGLLTMMIRQMRDSDSGAVTVLNNLGSAFLLLPAVILFGTLSVSGYALTLLIIMGVVQFGIPYYLFSLGLRRVPAYQAALVVLIEPVLVPVWTYLAVSEVPPTTTFIGGTIILAALVLFLRASRKSAAALRRVSA